MNPKIAIGITTRNREESLVDLQKTLAHNYLFHGIDIFIVDDCSDVKYTKCGPIDYRFKKRAGISNAKNKALQLCYESMADHIFILDDDVRMLKTDWWKPYVESGEHHLCATFLPANKMFYKDVVSDMKFKQEDNGNLITASLETKRRSFKTHLLGNGYCLYFTRHCIETVGGFDTNYHSKYEHCDLSRRIYNARLTNHVYQDVAHSSSLIYCLDQDNAIQRSFTNREMQDNLKAGYEYFRSRENSSEYIEFRT